MPKLGPEPVRASPLNPASAGPGDLAALYQFTDRLFRARSVEEVYEAALQAIEDAMGCARASILRFDPEGVMRFVAWRGLSDQYRQAVDGHSPWREGDADAEPILLSDIDAADEPDALKALIRAEGVRALGFFPLTAAGRVSGKFMVYYDEPHDFSDHDVDLAVTIARQLGFSLERLFIEESLARERELFQTIVDRIPAMITVYEPRQDRLRLNREFERVLGWTSENAAGVSLMEELFPDAALREEVRAFMEACPEGWLDIAMRTKDGRSVATSWANIRLSDGARVGIGLDISPRKASEAALQRQAERLALLNWVAGTLSRDLDLERIVQAATDSATSLSGAQFGAFFYNVDDEAGERYTLFALSGARRDAFEAFGLPRNTALFGPTFRGEGVIRSDNVQADERYGRSAPHFGMPQGHLPVVSYLAVPVISRSGMVHGGLFFGHDQPGVFQQDDEELVAAIAAHAALALDNAALLQSKQHEIDQRRQAEYAARRLAAIVESSEDAILSKDLDGIISSWNAGAERLLGYRADEVVGKSVMMLIPDDHRVEEASILAQVRAGNRVAPFETVRLCKSGDLLHVSLSVSPLRDGRGAIVGASTIVRDISERLRAEERQQLLLREMDHRIKNLFTLAGSLVTLSARNAENPAALATSVRERLSALAKAHALTLPERGLGGGQGPATTLHALIRTILSPYDGQELEAERLCVRGADLPLGGEAVTAFALLLHEFATNAAKYGALSTPTGRVEISCVLRGERFELTWTETGGPPVIERDIPEGFGSRLAKATAKSQLGGDFARDWRPEGLVIRLSGEVRRLQAPATR